VEEGPWDPVAGGRDLGGKFVGGTAHLTLGILGHKGGLVRVAWFWSNVHVP